MVCVNDTPKYFESTPKVANIDHSLPNNELAPRLQWAIDFFSIFTVLFISLRFHCKPANGFSFAEQIHSNELVVPLGFPVANLLRRIVSTFAFMLPINHHLGRTHLRGIMALRKRVRATISRVLTRKWNDTQNTSLVLRWHETADRNGPLIWPIARKRMRFWIWRARN